MYLLSLGGVVRPCAKGAVNCYCSLEILVLWRVGRAVACPVRQSAWPRGAAHGIRSRIPLAIVYGPEPGRVAFRPFGALALPTRRLPFVSGFGSRGYRDLQAALTMAFYFAGAVSLLLYAKRPG